MCIVNVKDSSTVSGLRYILGLLVFTRGKVRQKFKYPEYNSLCFLLFFHAEYCHEQQQMRKRKRKVLGLALKKGSLFAGFLTVDC